MSLRSTWRTGRETGVLPGGVPRSFSSKLQQKNVIIFKCEGIARFASAARGTLSVSTTRWPNIQYQHDSRQYITSPTFNINTYIYMVIIPPHLLADLLFCQNLYYGNAGDSMYSHNGLPFSTFDVDNDNRSTSIYQQDLSRPNLDSIFPPKNLTDRLHKDLVTEQNLSWNIFQGWRVCREKLCPIVQGELFCDCRHKSGCLLIVLTTPMTMQWLCTRWQSDTGWLVVRQLPWRKLERWVTAPTSEQLKSYKTDKLLPCPLPHPLTSIYHLGQSFVPQLGKFQTTQVYYGTVSNNSCWNIHWF